MLKACGDTESIDKAEGIYDEIVNNGFLHKDPILGTALVDMYAKCGILLKAQEVLEQLPMQDVVSWNALIAGQALQCQGYEALNTFYSMQRQGICPNKVTFLCVLSACCHSGLWNEAKQILDNMMRSYGIKPNIEHLTCMLVVLGYAGKFDQAMAMIEAMPYFDDPTVWLTLLGACKKWGNVKLGRLAFDQVIQLHTSCATPYVLMAELFWACGMTEDAKYVEGMRTTIHKE
jgi:pentatricopeptide repeat protein